MADHSDRGDSRSWGSRNLRPATARLLNRLGLRRQPAGSEDSLRDEAHDLVEREVNLSYSRSAVPPPLNNRRFTRGDSASDRAYDAEASTSAGAGSVPAGPSVRSRARMLLRGDSAQEEAATSRRTTGRKSDQRYEYQYS